MKIVIKITGVSSLKNFHFLFIFSLVSPFYFLVRKNFLSAQKLKISCFAVFVTSNKTVKYSYF